MLESSSKEIHMEIRKLEYFVAVCKHMNMTKAADELLVAQPSISNSIKALESELGFEFFDRSKRQLQLTEEGHVFYKRAVDILSHIDDVSREMTDLGRSSAGTIKLGVPPMIGTLIFPRLLVDYKKRHPHIKLQLTEDGSLETKRKIIDGEVDLGIIILTDENEHLDTCEILDTEIVTCMNRSHRLGRHSKITPALLEKEKLVMLKEGFYHREVILNYFKKHGAKPNIAVSTNQLATLESLVIQGIGISFLFKELVMDNSKMIYRPLGEYLPIKIGLAWRKDRYLSRASKTLINYLEHKPTGL